MSTDQKQISSIYPGGIAIAPKLMIAAMIIAGVGLTFFTIVQRVDLATIENARNPGMANLQHQAAGASPGWAPAQYARRKDRRSFLAQLRAYDKPAPGVAVDTGKAGQ